MGETKKEIMTRLKNIEPKLDTILSQIDSRRSENDPRSIIGLGIATEITGLSKSTIYNFASNRQIPHYKRENLFTLKGKSLNSGSKVAK